MKAYLLSIMTASLAIALVNILTPGTQVKYVKLVTSLVLVCVLIVPLKSAVETVIAWGSGELEIPGIETDNTDDIQQELENATTEASKAYVAQRLSEALQAEFSMDTGTVRVHIEWSTGDTVRPRRVRVLLSGSSIWKNPHEIQAYVEELLGCECVTAIE